MRHLIQTLSVGAALVTVAVGVWRDYGLALTLKRTVMAYLAVYGLSAVSCLAGRAALHGVRDPEPPPEPDPAEMRRQARKAARASAPPATPEPDRPAPETAPNQGQDGVQDRQPAAGVPG
jgi:hypothetical protein